MSNSLTEQSLPAGQPEAEPGASHVDEIEPAQQSLLQQDTPASSGLSDTTEQSEPQEVGADAQSARITRDKQDSKTTSRGTTSLDVEIFGAVYHVRGEQDPDYLQKLAGVVDGKMREISHHLPVVDSGKIAILAALNLADELLQCNNQQEGERVEMMEKVEELTGVLTKALDD